ncbi:hypothetical protein BDW59DRAFT_142693 [Aspergillus cavernicola]|uniref:Mtf2-like C-terminal domain-containing protein n=1 Tax=Aspergillus cavernicola TaxID=176166 RepID=A0ABR4IML5_9EURO
MSIHRRIARTWLAQATRSSLAPFLYQTRTLTTIHPHPLRFKSQQCSLFSTLESSSSPQAEQRTPAENDNSSGHDHSHERNSPTEGARAPAPRTSYLRRRAASLTQHQNATLEPRDPPEYFPTSPEYLRKSPESFPESPGNSPDSPANTELPTNTEFPARTKSIAKTRRSAKTKRPTKANRKPKMTTQETRAFAGLFEQIGLVGNSLSGGQLARQQVESTSKAADRQEMQQISDIFDTVKRDMEKLQKQADIQEPTTENQEDTVTEAPPSPIQDKPQTEFYTNEELSELLSMNEVIPGWAIKLVVDREATRIKDALNTATNEGAGEAGIWKICKEQIFSLMQHLGGNKETASVLDGLELPGDLRYPHDAQSTTSTATKGPLDIPEFIPIEPIVTALYPRMLLSAFCLLNLHFPHSPLIGQFRSTITSLGRESAVLGSSTALYNEMIYFYWRGCHDLPGVMSLLREMEVMGIDPDSRTCAILSAIPQQREDDLMQRRIRGHVAAHEPWWDLPPNRKAMRELLGTDGWIHRLSERLKERKERDRITYDSNSD